MSEYLDADRKELQRRVNEGELLSDREDYRLHNSDTEIRHEKFPKIPRLYWDTVATEKIDGTNAQIYVREDGLVLAGSRKRWLTPDNDNFGFAAWVKEHEDKLRQLGPGRHYGEWWGKGIQRGYQMDEQRFSLFNFWRWRNYWSIPMQGNLPPEDELKRDECPECCSVVPILTVGILCDTFITFALNLLKDHGSYINSNFRRPEGIVLIHVAGRQSFKVTFEDDGIPSNIFALKGHKRTKKGK